MKQNLILAIMILTLGGYAAVMPGCGDKANQPTNTGYYNCQPGQTCVANVAQGIPLLNGAAIGYLDPGHTSNLVLTFGAPNVVAGQAYVGPVNISGVLHLAPGLCGPGGDFQISGQGNWEAGFGGYAARVSGSLQVVGGSGGYVNIAPTLVGALPPPGVNGYNYFLGYSPGVTMSMCGGYSFPLY